jgi:hypothetical protein
VIRPVSATWPDKDGRFRIVLPGSARGQALRLWQDAREVFSASGAAPGGGIPLAAWPSGLTPRVPQGLAEVTAPR